MQQSFLWVQSQAQRHLLRLELAFDLVMKFLPVAIELHDALRFLLQPELIKLVSQVAYKQRKQTITTTRKYYNRNVY